MRTVFTAITDSAYASDGGSMALSVMRSDGREEHFHLNRSIASRGTPDFNRVTSDLRPLCAHDCAEIAEALTALLTEANAIHPVGKFVEALKAQAL